MKPIIIAHRGNNFTYPENTLAGLRSAFELGCKAVEFDIQMTADEVLIILHDDNTLRTSGVEKSALASNYEELQHISIHEPDRLGDKYESTFISKLEEVIPLLEAFPSHHMYIEVKEESLEKWGRQKVLDNMLPIIEAHAEQCTIISFDLPVLDLIRKQSNVSIGWVLYHYDEASLAQAKKSKLDYLIVDQTKLKLDIAPWAGPWKWMIYGVDSVELALSHYKNGISHIETDALDRLLMDERLKP